MHFTGAAMIWLEDGGFTLRNMEWEPFCFLVCEQFEPNEFTSLLCQFFIGIKRIRSPITPLSSTNLCIIS